MATYVIENIPFLGVTSLMEIESGEVVRSFTGVTRLADCLMYANVRQFVIADDPGHVYPPIMEGEHRWS